MEWRGHRCDPSGRFVGPGWRIPLQRYSPWDAEAVVEQRDQKCRLHTKGSLKSVSNFCPIISLCALHTAAHLGFEIYRRRCWRAAAVPWLVIPLITMTFGRNPSSRHSTPPRSSLLFSYHPPTRASNRDVVAPTAAHYGRSCRVRGRPLRRLHLQLGSLAEPKGPINHWFCIDEWQRGYGRFGPE